MTTPALWKRIHRRRNDAFKKDRNVFQALNQVLINLTQVADDAKLAMVSDDQIFEIIRKHIEIYSDRIRALNNPPEGSGSYGEYADLQQRIYAIEVYLPLEGEPCSAST